jgi:phosphatidate cytidylyltransferase
MKTRAITAFFFTIVMLGSVFLGGIVFSIFYLILQVLALLEFYKLVKTSGARPIQFLGVGIAMLGFLFLGAHYLFEYETKYLILLVPLIFSVFIYELYMKEKIPFANIGYTFLGILFVTIPFGFYYSLGFIQDNRIFNFHFPLAFLLMLWASDTGAYLFGRKLGKTRLFERHSPKKSWEGFFGGVFTSVLVAVIISFIFKEVAVGIWVGMAVLVVSFGTLGDLVESMLKRSLDVKDSGTLLPGHGGLLDRFDGLLIAAPLVYTYLYLALSL